MSEQIKPPVRYAGKSGDNDELLSKLKEIAGGEDGSNDGDTM